MHVRVEVNRQDHRPHEKQTNPAEIPPGSSEMFDLIVSARKRSIFVIVRTELGKYYFPARLFRQIILPEYDTFNRGMHAARARPPQPSCHPLPEGLR